jgi:hypothetical protein
LRYGGGVSQERDYHSAFANIGMSRDFSQKRTTVSADLSYTRSRTDAILDHDALPYIYGLYDWFGNPVYNQRYSGSTFTHDGNHAMIHGKREDLGLQGGITQIIDKNSLFGATLGYTRTSGYQANPYKVVEVVFAQPADPASDYAWYANVNALPEQRPDTRNRSTLDLKYIRHFERSDGALHLNYGYSHDDWGIRAHTLEASWAQPFSTGWSVTPRIRYYTQSAANFYAPYLVTLQPLFVPMIDPVQGQLYYDNNNFEAGARYYVDQTGTVVPPIDNNPDSWNYGNPITYGSGAVIDKVTGQPVGDQAVVDNLMEVQQLFDQNKLPRHYSSDARLAGYGTLGIGVTLSKQLQRGFTLEFGYERSKRASSLQFGGDGGSGYADYSFWLANAVLKIDLEEARFNSVHADHAPRHATKRDASAPAGIMLAHMPQTAGELMAGYHFHVERRAHDMQHGTATASDHDVVQNGCAGNPCNVRPTVMNMHMQMLELMYALDGRTAVMLMPKYVAMDMDMRPLDGAPISGGMGSLEAVAIMHAGHTHESGGIGDTEIHVLRSLMREENEELHVGAGLSLPTGKSGLKFRDTMGVHLGYLPYDMQLGSGTIDFLPSLTYTRETGGLTLGAQARGVLRMKERNLHGYALGNILQTTLWTGRNFSNGWAASLRAMYTSQGAIRGAFTGDTLVHIGPSDVTGNYGGRFLDAGLGIAKYVQGGSLAGSRFALEWLQPVSDRPNGYQLQRAGSLFVSWSSHL